MMVCAFAQAPEASGIERLIAQDAARLLDHDAPEVRGEAALVVAASGDVRHEARLLELASDPAPAARRRALLALGLLATPAAVQHLERQLGTVDGRRGDDGVAAAYALGSVVPAQAQTSVARTLALFRRGSWKRQHDVLLALLQAMARHPDRQELGALRLLSEEDANRADDVRGALLRLRLPIDRSLSRGELERALRRSGKGVRRAVVGWLARRPIDEQEPWLDELTALAARDRDPEVRALALLGLTRSRHLPGLEIAARALQSGHPGERRQAAVATLAIGGASMRGVLERHLLDERDLERLGALLEGYRAPPSRALLDRAVAVATDAATPTATRVAAAELVARSEPLRAAPMLRDLFLATSDTALLGRVARALRRVEEQPTELSKLVAEPLVLRHHGDRWRALLAAGHSEAQRQVLSTLQDRDAPDAALCAALKAWRKATVLDEQAASPDGLRQTLQ